MAAFDEGAFEKTLKNLREHDRKWIQFRDQERCYDREGNKLTKEVDRLEKTVRKVYRVESKEERMKLKRDLAFAMADKTLYQRNQRSHELERDLLLKELKTTSEDMKLKIKHRLEKAERQIRECKDRVSDWFSEVNKIEERLGVPKSQAPLGHILTKDELIILARLLAEYSDEKLKQIRLSFETKKNQEISREDIERSLRESGLTSIADDLKENIEKGIENQKHYEAYESALRDGLALIMRYLKIVFIGPPRTGKSSTLRRLLHEIINLSSIGEPSVSTGVTETNDVIIKKMTSEAAAIPQWRSFRRSKEGRGLAMYSDEDLGYLTQLFYKLISKNMRESQQKTSVSATAVHPDSNSELEQTVNTKQNPDKKKKQNKKHSPLDFQDQDRESVNVVAKLKAKVSSVTLEDSEEMEIDEAFKKLTAVLRSDSPEDLKKLLEALTMANMADVGGQPAFLDVLPTLTVGPALYLLFFRLDQEFRKHYPVRFCSADSKAEITLETSYCIEEVICQALSSIVCFSHQASQKSTESASSRAILFGTYKDKVTDDEISEKEKTIQEKLMGTKLHEEGLLLKTNEGRSFFTVDNMFGTDESEMTDIRKNLEAIITSMFPTIDIPASWLMFRMVLHLLHKPVVSLSQCAIIASRLSMTTPVEEAIWFFHHNIGSLMHYPDIPSMKELVICNPQVIFDSISKLIIEKLQYANYTVAQSVVDKFLQKGQFTLSDIEDKTEDQRTDLLTPKQLVDLLKDRNILAETKPDQDKSVPSESKFIMPTVLKYASEEDLKLPTSAISKLETSPLVIHFESGFVPFGVFCASVANLIARQHSMSPIWQLCDNQVMKNKVKFCIDEAFYATLVSRPQYIEIRVERHSRARSKCSLPNICSTVRQTVVQTLEMVISKMKYKPYAKIETPLFLNNHPFTLAFSCCLEISHNDHLMKVHKDESEYYGLCHKDGIGLHLEKEHLIWFCQTEQVKCVTSQPTKVPDSNSSAPQNTATTMDQAGLTATKQLTTDDISELKITVILPSEVLSAPPLCKNDLNTVMSRLWPARSKWYLIGCLLKIDIGTLEAIKRDNGNLSDDCFIRMLSTWLQCDSSLWTWKTLVDVLQSPIVGVRLIMSSECKDTSS